MQILKDDIRERILDAARRQFARKSYAKTSMREIAREAGIGVGNIYNYFPGKDELFREAVSPVLCALEACAPWKPCCKNTTAYGAKIL